MPLRVASYNVHGGTDSDRHPSLDQIIATLRGTNADIILLQEIDRLLPRSGFQDQFSRIANGIDYKHRAFYGRLCFGPCAFGNAILSRLPVDRWHRLPLPSQGGEPRAAIGATLKKGATVWCTHLGLREEWRRTQLTALAAALNSGVSDKDAASGPPTILGGDFNASLAAAEMGMLRDLTYLNDFGEESPTFPSITPLQRIDHLLARGFTRQDAGTREDLGSDHRLIWADFEPILSPP